MRVHLPRGKYASAFASGEMCVCICLWGNDVCVFASGEMMYVHLPVLLAG